MGVDHDQSGACQRLVVVEQGMGPDDGSRFPPVGKEWRSFPVF